MTKAESEEKVLIYRENALAWIRLWVWEKGWFILIPFIFITIFVWIGIDIPPVTVKDNQGNFIREQAQTLYLLSAIAQSLAAIFALVFTISLVVAQLSSQYSHRMLKSFFDTPTILYLLLFIISVLLPFWLLAEPNSSAVKVSLSLSAACLLLLIPYFLRFRQTLNPESLILDLKRKALKQLQVNPSKEPEEIARVENIIRNALKLNDYEMFTFGVESLATLVVDYQQIPNKKMEVVITILERLRNITTENIDDPRVPHQIIESLGYVGTEALTQGMNIKIAEWVSGSLGNIGMVIINKGLDVLLAEKVFRCMSDIGSLAAKRKETERLNLVLSVSANLRRISVSAIEKEQRSILELVSNYLSEIGKSVIDDGAVEDKASILSWISKDLFEIIMEAVRKNQENAAIFVFSFLSDMIYKCQITSEWKGVLIISGYLKEIALPAVEVGMQYLVKNISNTLNNIKFFADEEGRENISKDLSRHLYDIQKKS